MSVRRETLIKNLSSKLYTEFTKNLRRLFVPKCLLCVKSQSISQIFLDSVLNILIATHTRTHTRTHTHTHTRTHTHTHTHTHTNTHTHIYNYIYIYIYIYIYYFLLDKNNDNFSYKLESNF